MLFNKLTEVLIMRKCIKLEINSTDQCIYMCVCIIFRGSVMCKNWGNIYNLTERLELDEQDFVYNMAHQLVL